MEFTDGGISGGICGGGGQVITTWSKSRPANSSTITVLIHTCVCSYTLCMVFTKQDNDTALIFACQEDNLTTASVLLKAGAYPNICNKVICKYYFVLVSYLHTATM